MKLIFDCGSTKCSIVHLDHNDAYLKDMTIEGFNPVFFSNISQATYAHFSAPLKENFSNIESVLYCGAGCIDSVTNDAVEKGFLKIFPNSSVNIYSDLEFLGHILKIKEKSIIGILGTGSNAGLWDGNGIIGNTISGGYLLGDEGSAFALGKSLLINFLRGNFSRSSQNLLKEEIDLGQMELINKIYSAELPNKEIASYAAIVSKIEHDPLTKDIIKECFEDYISKRIRPLAEEVSTIHLFGSVAYFNQEYLKPLLEEVNLQVGIIAKGPLDLIMERS